MNTKWMWHGNISAEVCRSIIAEAQVKGFRPGVVGEGVINPELRTNGVYFVPAMHIAECILGYHAGAANRNAGWEFDLTAPTEQTQIAEYKEGQHYGVHADSHDLGGGLERKLSATLMLSDPTDYDGGQLEVRGVSVGELRAGSIIVFPSFHFHQVTPVTRGARYTATAWIPGPSFR